MHYTLKAGIRASWVLLLLVIIASSCVPIKKRVYLQVDQADSTKKYSLDNTPSYKLQTGNNLYVRVVSVDEEVSAYFNFGMGTAGNVYYDAAVYLNSYSINDSGFVELPFLGDIYVKGLTLEQTKSVVQKEIENYLNNTMVVVRLVNYNVTVVGEVARPGQFKIYQDRINIFEVLSLAGDMTTFAKREEVVLVRKTETGSIIKRLNVLDDNLLESEYFYIMPEDILYVQPLKGRNFAFEAFPYTLVISSISLMLALFALFK
ncbi:MAG: polysaccharide biosynthesis/export family protein [Bacteroidales bacterium]|nr:polysaccharide biosynthesis/export family protein [Bacteroidales bacterium]MCF8405400.1 polysaccharide biosynthesis/export family protein [Bacteroidales bacterium]